MAGDLCLGGEDVSILCIHMVEAQVVNPLFFVIEHLLLTMFVNKPPSRFALRLPLQKTTRDWLRLAHVQLDFFLDCWWKALVIER